MAVVNPWDSVSGSNNSFLIVTQEMLNVSKKSATCFVNFSRLQQITNIQAEIKQKNLEIELLRLENDTADTVHLPFWLKSVLLCKA